jgi:hypothetical protein
MGSPTVFVMMMDMLMIQPGSVRCCAGTGHINGRDDRS